MHFKKILLCLLLIILSAGMVSCSDSGTDAESNSHDKAPAIPDLSKIQPDLSFFQNNKASGTITSSESAYTRAKELVFAGAVSAGIIQGFVAYLRNLKQVNPEFKNDMWVWSAQGASGGFKLTAKVGNDATTWELTISGEGLDDAKAVDGVIQNDENSGVWKLYDIDSGGSLSLKSEFDITSDTKRRIVATNYDEETGEVVGVSAFDINEPTHSLIEDIAPNNHDEIYWNTDTKTGYVIEKEGSTLVKRCWNSSLAEAPCSD